jgi:SAM-dependent methyltransferase
MDSTASKPAPGAVLQIRQVAFAIRRSIAARGLLRTLVHFARRATPAGGQSSRASQTHPFDTEYGLETSGLISGRDLAAGHVHDLDSTAYYGIAPSILRSAISYWSAALEGTGSTIEQYSFVDLGAGKGRAVLLASEYQFRSVSGVELNPQLARIADRNAAQWKALGRARCAVEIFNQDAAEFRWPPAPLLVFLFNPFGRKVLSKVLHNLKLEANRTGKPVDVLYINPEFRFIADRFPGLQKLWTRRIEMSESDRAVDAFSSRSEMCSAYRFQPVAGSALRS